MIGQRVASLDDVVQAGDYWLNPALDPNGQRSLWFLLPLHEGTTLADRFNYAHKPGNGLHRVAEPVWTFRECADGSIEVRPSIACGRGSESGEYWHGWLDEGHVWRSC